MTTTAAATLWIGTEPTLRIAAHVPAEVERAIEAYETAKRRRELASHDHIAARRAGEHWLAQKAIDACLVNGRLMEQWWGRLAALLPVEAGWWPYNGMLYGYAKRDGCGLKLVRQAGASAWPNESRARDYEVRMGRRRADEARTRAWFDRRKSTEPSGGTAGRMPGSTTL